VRKKKKEMLEINKLINGKIKRIKLKERTFAASAVLINMDY
jgi:hypothetical protein